MTTIAKRRRGFTIIEMLVVVAIIGLLAGIVAVNVQNTMTRTRMSTLKHDLRVMRDLIQQYKVDKKIYPESLQSLADEGYMRALPIDPFTDSSSSWIEIFNEPDPEADEVEAEDQGVIDVQSGAAGVDLEGVPFAEY